MLDVGISDTLGHMESELAGINIPTLEVPAIETLERDRSVIQVGDIDHARQVWEQQGHNQFGFQGTCGLASIAAELRLFGVQISEREVVDYAVANGLCELSLDPAKAGGVTFDQQVQILQHFGVPAHAQFILGNAEVADAIARGQGVLVSLNAGPLWYEECADYITTQGLVDAFGNHLNNHGVEVVGYDVDPKTKEITGFFVNDTGVPNGAAHFVSAEAFGRATGNGVMVVTDLKPRAPNA